MTQFLQNNNNELQEIAMNLAIFLHNQKQYKDSFLPLPLAPIYAMPHQRWYFSSASMTPLRKRRENTSLFKYLQDLQILTEKRQNNKHEALCNIDQQILCVYEKNNYFDNKIKHIFESIYTSFGSNHSGKQKTKCDCNEYIDEDSSKYFITRVDTLNKCLDISKKNLKDETITHQEQKINWYQFTKNLISSKLNIQSHSIPQQSLFLYKLPQSKDNGTPYIFNILWNDNYLIFNNGNKLQINQNMKSKAVELCESIYKKLQTYIWTKIQTHISKIAQEVSEHLKFIYKLQQKVKISTFRIWFYKKDENNQIYILNLSHLTFKGVQCIIYNNFNVKNQSIIVQDIAQQQIIVNDIEPLKNKTEEKIFQNKKKAFSVSNKSHKNIRNLLKPSSIQRMKDLCDDKAFEVAIVKPQKMLIQQEWITQIQCYCCKNLMTANQIVNQITSNHVQQIKYLRQIRIGNKQQNPYNFVKICTVCYNVYLNHYKKMLTEKRNDNNLLKNSKSGKNSQNFLEKASYNFQDYKSRDSSFKISNSSSKRLIFGKQSNKRAKSELNNSKQQPQFSTKNDKIIDKDRSISLRPPIYQPTKNQRHKKIHTLTNNTENTINRPQQLIDFNNTKIQIQRARTQQQHSILSNHNSDKFRNQLQNKTKNLINQIICNSFQTKKTTEEQDISHQEESIKNINAKIIINAIDQYQKIDRISFKKLITKNHRMYMIKQPSKESIKKDGNTQVIWRKSIKSYFQN